MKVHNMSEYFAMNVFCLSVLIISQLVSQINAVDESFIVPSPDAKSLSYREGSTLSLAWVTTLDRIALTLWQDGNATLEYIDGNSDVSNTNSWPWRVFTQKQNINDTSTFFIAIYNPGETTPRFSSGHFNILRESAASTSPGTPSSSSVPTSSSSSPVPTFSPSSSVPTPSLSSSRSDSGLNSRTKPGVGLGLGIGLGIGIPFFLGLGIFLGCFLRPNRKNAASDADDDYYKPMGGGIGNLPSPQQTHGLIPMHELGFTETSELDSQALQELGPETQPR